MNRVSDISSESTPVVAVRDAYKRYTPKSVVLAGLNMTIEKGTIYGLLGPSGCGKSTLLNCIVGRQSLDSGSVIVSFRDKQQVGYMPQDLALNLDLTIGELLMFYGRVYQLSWEKLEQKMQDLMELLQLPPKGRLVGDCSGGQQRRVSMAITLIHDPELLILDEPTVGIDPVLCASIWECFFELVYKRNKTILITTHYIEEAKSANRIGLMRNGELLAENSPKMLMEKFNCENLEDVFLKLSQVQEKQMLEKDYPPKQKPQPPFKNVESFNKVRFMTQLKKNWDWSKRNLGVTLFVLFMPTFCLVVICSADILNLVTTPAAIVVPRNHVCPSYVKPVRPCLKIADFVCRYKQILEEKYPVVLYRDYDEAYRDGKKGRVVVVIQFKDNFTAGFMERLELQTASSLKALEDGTMYTAFDMSSFPIAGIIMRKVYGSLEDLLLEICEQCKYHEKMAHIPLSLPEPVFGGRDWKFQDSFMPQTIVPFLFYTIFLYSSAALSMEIGSGLLERYQIAGLTLTEILAAQASLQLIVLNLQNISTIIMIYGLFGMAMAGSIFTCFFLLFTTELFGFVAGVTIALLIQKETPVSMIGLFLQFHVFVFCGCIWPIEGQHWFLRMIAICFPTTHLSQSYFDVSLRGWPISKYEVWSGILIGYIGSIVCAVFTAACLKLKLVKV